MIELDLVIVRGARLSSDLKKMLNTMPQIGTVWWIGLRPFKGGPINVVDQVVADINDALRGDRFIGSAGAQRQVTLIQKEHLDVIASLLGEKQIDPALLRRNIVVSGINLLALKNRSFQIGDAVLCATGNCQPCSQMERNLGPGGYNAVRGHGGITASVSTGGVIKLGDNIRLIDVE